MFPIRRVERSEAVAVEQLGSKPKFWFTDDGGRFLFKADDRGTGEDWAEVVASNLCGLLGLPHVEYELAEEWNNGVLTYPGVVCPNMSPSPLSLVLGNQLLLQHDPEYPTEQRFKVRQHTIDAVISVLATLDVPDRGWMPSPPPGVQSAFDVFVGYVMLDAWIANQDRHHENWAALRGTDLRLAPTFDHGAGLARNLTDRERAERLNTKDRNRTVEAFSRRASTAFYASQNEKKTLGTFEAYRLFAAKAPVATSAWIQRLTDIDPAAVRAILDEVPPQRMSPITNEFTRKLLESNRRSLLSDPIS